jgi:hypothetical protein
VHLVEQGADPVRMEDLERLLKHAAAEWVGRELKDVALERIGDGRGRVESDETLDDVVGVGRLDTVDNVALQLGDELVALVDKDVLERLLNDLVG